MTSHQPPAFIHDGYTRPFYLAPVPGLYPAVRGHYRPMLSQARAVIYSHIGNAGPAKGEAIAAEAIAKHIVDWDIKDHVGESVDVTGANALKLQPKLSARLFRIVAGDHAPDAEPEASAAEASEDAERELAAALAGESIEEHDAKN